MLSAHDWQRPVESYPWLFLIQEAHGANEFPRTLRLAVHAPDEMTAESRLRNALPTRARAFCYRISRADFPDTPTFSLNQDGTLRHEGFNSKN